MITNQDNPAVMKACREALELSVERLGKLKSRDGTQDFENFCKIKDALHLINSTPQHAAEPDGGVEAFMDELPKIESFEIKRNDDELVTVEGGDRFIHERDFKIFKAVLKTLLEEKALRTQPQREGVDVEALVSKIANIVGFTQFADDDTAQIVQLLRNALNQHRESEG